MKITPHKARYLLLFGAFLLALPGLVSLYKGHTGKLLVATGAMSEGPFRESVIYLVSHNYWHAYGFIVNKPLDPQEIKEGFPQIEFSGKNLYYGGPVYYPGTAVIFRPGPEVSSPLVNTGNIHLPGYDVIYSSLKRALNPEGNERTALGVAGWAPMQLNREIFRGGWAVIDYDPALVFETPPEKMWAEAMKRAVKEKPESVVEPGS